MGIVVSVRTLDKENEMLYNSNVNKKNPEIGSLEFFTTGVLAAAGIFLGEFQKLGAEPI